MIKKKTNYKSKQIQNELAGRRHIHLQDFIILYTRNVLLQFQAPACLQLKPIYVLCILNTYNIFSIILRSIDSHPK